MPFPALLNNLITGDFPDGILVSNRYGLSSICSGEYWYDKIDTNWHLPDYFFDDVKSVDDEMMPKVQ